MSDALEWEQSAMSKRRYSHTLFERIALEIRSATVPAGCILELGSGPGFLTEFLLPKFGECSYVLLDFSPAMHELARRRLGRMASQVEFLERDFKEAGWSKDLGLFDCVVTIQAVHELRHKRHAFELHSRVRQHLVRGGIYLVCDHFVGDGGMSNGQLYMTPQEQMEALHAAGFSEVDEIMQIGSLVLLRAA